jgi:hypothetical protein
VRKATEGLTFDIAINRNPPVLGDNEIRIEIKDLGGNPVLDAAVMVNYYMPPMPRRVPMSHYHRQSRWLEFVNRSKR